MTDGKEGEMAFNKIKMTKSRYDGHTYCCDIVLDSLEDVFLICLGYKTS